jgi:formamidopyrimidine-DNA glycosylase
MPELPEVETVMRGLIGRLQGRRIVRVAVNRPDLRQPFPPDLATRVKGAVVQGFRRRGKYILMRLEGGNSLLLHLGMSGRLLLGPSIAGAATSHEHLVFETDDGTRMAFSDPRRFGRVDLLETAVEDIHPLLAGLGPEPLADDFTPERLAAALAGRRTSIKAALIDQRVVAGIGNIYACESLYRAALSPRRLAGSISGRRAARLTNAIRETLAEAVAAGGSSLRDYVQPDGELGMFQHAWKVYGRERELCPKCPGSTICTGIARIAQGGRSTFYCPRLQR